MRTRAGTDLQNAFAAAGDVIRDEAVAVKALSGRIGKELFHAIELLRDIRGKIVLAGLGKSGLIARKIAATLSSTGSPALFIHAAEAGHGDIGILGCEDAVIVVSKSGKTREILSMIPAIKRLGCPIISITGDCTGELARYSDAVLDASVQREACPMNLAPTSSTTVALVLGDALAVALLTARGFSEKDFSILHPAGNLGKRFYRVSDLMKSGSAIPVVSPGTGLKRVIFVMSSGRLGVCCVVKNRKLDGIITDGDLRRFLQKSDSSKIDLAIRAQQIMTRHPESIGPDALAAEALSRMEKKKITSLPVTGRNGVLSGIVHLHDLVEAGIDSWQL